MDQRLRRQWTTQILRTRAKWSSRSEHSCVCGAHTSQDGLQEMLSVSNNVGMKMKQMLKPKAVPTVFPKALPNCSPPLYKKTLMNVQHRRGTKSTNHVEKTWLRQRVCQITLSMILTTANRWIWILPVCFLTTKKTMETLFSRSVNCRQMTRAQTLEKIMVEVIRVTRTVLASVTWTGKYIFFLYSFGCDFLVQLHVWLFVVTAWLCLLWRGSTN